MLGAIGWGEVRGEQIRAQRVRVVDDDDRVRSSLTLLTASWPGFKTTSLSMSLRPPGCGPGVRAFVHFRELAGTGLNHRRL